jgi:ABC-2 type transport system ATP-binding protein
VRKISLIINNVTKSFSGATAVDNLSLEIPKGAMFGLLGGNGAGKTTTFRMALGLLSPTEGQVLWDGQKLDYKTSHLVGYLPEERGLYPNIKVKDQLLYLGRLKGMNKKECIAQIEFWLNYFKVPEYANKKVEELSKGNQQKIQFIAAVQHKPKLIILDEPFSGLDPVNVQLLKKAVFYLKEQGATIVFSSHRMEHVEELCENLCILKKGKSVVSGSLREVKRSYGLKKLIIQADFPLDELVNIEGVEKMEKRANEIELSISSEQLSQTIFEYLQGKGFVKKFELAEPSLNEIFIEKVGEINE